MSTNSENIYKIENTCRQQIETFFKFGKKKCKNVSFVLRNPKFIIILKPKLFDIILKSILLVKARSW